MSSKTFDLSLIVPFYNAEKNFHRCLMSIKNQNFKGRFEILFINDCSKDNSLNIVKKNKLNNKRIFNLKKNKGPSNARNVGIKKSLGKYIYFLDADDEIKQNTLSTLFTASKKNKFDIIASDKKWIDNKKNQRANKFIFKKDKNLNETDIIKLMVNRFSDTISTVGMFGLTGKLIRRSIIKKNNIFFVNSMRNFEDETFMWDVIGVAKRIYYVKNQLYAHYVNAGSNTALSKGYEKSFSIKNFKKLKKHIVLSLKRKKFSKNKIKELSSKGFIYFIIASLISLTRSIKLKKITKKTGVMIRKKMIKSILEDRDIEKEIKFYKPSRSESQTIPYAIQNKLDNALENECDKRALKIINMRKAGKA